MLTLKDVVIFIFIVFHHFLVQNAPQNITKVSECFGQIIYPVYTIVLPTVGKLYKGKSSKGGIHQHRNLSIFLKKNYKL